MFLKRANLKRESTRVLKNMIEKYLMEKSLFVQIEKGFKIMLVKWSHEMDAIHGPHSG